MILACAHCSGEVNVSCYNGEKLRCGCGKTYASNPDFRAPSVVDDGGLAGLLALLRANGVKRYRAGEVEIEMELPTGATQDSRTGVIAVPPAESAKLQIELDADVCDCGHDVDQHTDSGCMVASCDPAVCEKWAATKQAVA